MFGTLLLQNVPANRPIEHYHLSVDGYVRFEPCSSDTVFQFLQHGGIRRRQLVLSFLRHWGALSQWSTLRGKVESSKAPAVAINKLGLSAGRGSQRGLPWPAVGCLSILGRRGWRVRSQRGLPWPAVGWEPRGVQFARCPQP